MKEFPNENTILFLRLDKQKDKVNYNWGNNEHQQTKLPSDSTLHQKHNF